MKKHKTQKHKVFIKHEKKIQETQTNIVFQKTNTVYIYTKKNQQWTF